METVNAPSTELKVFTNSLEVFQGGGAILEKNTTSVERAVAAGDSLLKRIKASGMTAEVDAEVNSYLLKVKSTYSIISESRKPITQIMDEVKKIFTGLETKIDPKSKDNIYFLLTEERNKFARQQQLLQQQKEEEARRQLAKNNEQIGIISEIEIGLSNHFNNLLLAEKQNLIRLFNSITYDSFIQESEKVRKYAWMFSRMKMKTYKLNKFFSYHDAKAVDVMIADVLTREYDSMFQQFTNDLTALKSDMIDKLPSKLNELKEQHEQAERQRQLEIAAKMEKDAAKKKELEEQAAAAEKERERLAEIEAQRVRAEEAQIQREADEQKAKDEIAADSKKMISETEAMLTTEAAVMETAPATKTREGYKIIVTHPLGFMEIFKYWFENEGKSLSVEQIEKKTMLQMKTFCEKQALKTDEQIESKFLKYEETIKVLTTKP